MPMFAAFHHAIPGSVLGPEISAEAKALQLLERNYSQGFFMARNATFPFSNM